MPFLPDQNRDGEIKFKLAKSLPYRRRLQLIWSFLVLGFALQIILQSVYWGLPFLLIASLLSLVTGYDAKPPAGSAASTWEQVTTAELNRIKILEKRNKSWDQSFLDITCVTGFFTLLFIIVGVFIIRHFLIDHGAARTATLISWDSAVLILPHYVTGVRSILTHPGLIIKTDIIMNLIKWLKRMNFEDVVAEPMMETIETPAGSVPQDVKLMLKFRNAPETFLGLQVQVSLNNVQGKDYPYVYCVLVARKDFGLPRKIKEDPPRRMVLTFSGQEDVEVAVLRQYTSRTSGYHTPPKRQKEILKTGIKMAQQVLAES